MFIGRGFDINNDGSNDIFVGGMLTDAQKRANQEIGGLILGLGCFGIAIYAVLAAFVGICFGVAELLESPVAKKYLLTAVTVVAGLLGVILTLYIISRVLNALYGLARKHGIISFIKYIFTCIIYGDDAAVNIFYCRRGDRLAGPLDRDSVKKALDNNRLRGDDLIAADSPHGPWELVSRAKSRYKLS